VIIVCRRFVVSRSSSWQILQLEAVCGWQIALLDAAQKKTSLAMISVRSRTSPLSGSAQRRV
jgi:hypothetical protein